LWLANFLSVPGVCVCDHEATQWAASSHEFWEKAERCPEPVYGNSDSANILVLPALLAARPLTKVVWIDRKIEDAAKSMRAAGFVCTKEGMDLLDMHRRRYRDLFDLLVPYEELGRLEIIKHIWRFLLGNSHFDFGRWGILESTKIAYDARHYIDHPRDTAKFLKFIHNEGEIPCLLK
jgi:hypothetical protein